jgi:hypothetical protein
MFKPVKVINTVTGVTVVVHSVDEYFAQIEAAHAALGNGRLGEAVSYKDENGDQVIAKSSRRITFVEV